MPITLLLHGKLGPTVRYEPLGPWLVPWQLGAETHEKDYRALRDAVGLIDYSTQAWLEVRGRDRIDFLQRLLTNNVAALKPGGGCRAALLTPNAKLIATCLVLADADLIWLACDLPQAAALAEALERYHFSEDVAITPHERRFGVLALEGPRAAEAVSQLTATRVALTRPGDHQTVALGDGPARLIHHSLTGGEGIWCVVEAERLESIWRWLTDQAPAGLRPVGWEVLNTARIEAGEPWFGLDMDASNLLPETGLAAVLASETKGCYVGQEIVARMGTYGSAGQRLMGIVLDEAVPASPGDRLMRSGDDVGRVTSSCVSPVIGRPIALAYVKRGSYEIGTRIEINSGEDRFSATVVPLPFIVSPKSVDRSP